LLIAQLPQTPNSRLVFLADTDSVSAEVKTGVCLDSTRVSGPLSAAAASAGQAGDDDAKEGDDGVDDGLQSGGNGVNDGHDAVADRAEDGLDLRTVSQCTGSNCLGSERTQETTAPMFAVV
jgi:hypothetical protein